MLSVVRKLSYRCGGQGLVDDAVHAQKPSMGRVSTIKELSKDVLAIFVPSFFPVPPTFSNFVLQCVTVLVRLVE
jgi:hypothetical protein